MPLGIKPTVDFAFKRIFGSPENVPLLIGLLNAILKPAIPIVHVEILNPFNYREFEDDKLIVLDIRARDSAGRWLNIEMQVSVFTGLLQRLVYYASVVRRPARGRRATPSPTRDLDLPAQQDLFGGVLRTTVFASWTASITARSPTQSKYTPWN